MFVSIFIFILGVLVGYCLLGMLASSKQADLWTAISHAAQNNDTTLCKEILNNN